MSIILLKLVIVVTLFLIGYGFSEVFLPDKFKKKALWFYPWLATVLISFMGAVLYYGTMSMSIGVYFIVFAAIFLFIYALFGKHCRPAFSKENAMILLVIVILSVSFSSSLNLFSLKEKAEFLRGNSILSTAGLSRSFYEDSNLIGSASLIAFFSVFLKQKVDIISNSLASIYLLLLYPLISGFFKKSTISAILSMAAVIIIYFLFKSFDLSLFHLIFLGMVLIFLILINDYLSHMTMSKKYIIYPTLFELLMAVTLSSLSTVYPPGFKLTGGLLIVIGLLNLLYQKRQKVWLYLGKIVIFAVIMNPIMVGAILWSK